MTDPPTQGARAGRNWPAEDDTYRDPTTGARVHRLTGYPNAGDHHLYFTKRGWYDGGRRLLVRLNRTDTAGRQLFSIDLESGLLTQVTDLDGFGGTSLFPAENVLYGWVGDAIVRFDLDTFTVEEVLYEVPDGYTKGTFDVGADQERLFVSMHTPVEVPGEDSHLVEMMEAKPPTRIVEVSLDTGDERVLLEEDGWLSTHMDASPTRPGLIMYPYQGPWGEFEDKVWVHDVDADERYSVRSTPGEGGIGHQHWLAGGERVGYHGWDGTRGDPDCFYGHARYDGSETVETSIPVRQTHCHTNAPDLFVCDGSTEVPWLLLYRWDADAEAYVGPRKLATHDWGADSPHPHARLSPDGSQVLFDSDRYEGSSDVYLVDVPAFESLPRYDPA
ncbi:MAG: oligogalacturonate lyase family protein [Halobacteriaceae archaeon]